MFSLTRRRREAERNKKLEDVFREADANGNGKIPIWAQNGTVINAEK
jgi:hypothetical protein